MIIEAVIFDFGDTIATLNPSKEKILGKFLSSKGIRISPEEIKYAYRISDYCHKQSAIKLKDQKDKKKFLLKINNELFKIMGLSLKSELWSKELYEYFKLNKKWELFPEALSAVDRLNKSGYKIALLANWDKGLNDLVKSLGIEKYFSHIICSEEVSMEKPDTDIFFHLLKLMSVEPDKIIYAGNEYETDVIGARNAGLMPVLIDRNNLWPNADCLRFENLIELNKYLEEI